MAGGATAVTQNAMARMFRDISAYRKKNHELRNALREYSRSLYDSDMDLEGCVPIDKAPYPCFTLCDRCGYLALNDHETCPACGFNAWLDLRQNQVFELVRETEAKERTNISSGASGVAFLLCMVLPIGMNLWLGHGFSTGIYGLLIVLSFIVGFALFYSLRKGINRLVRRFTKTSLLRWRFPVSVISKTISKRSSSRIVQGIPRASRLLLSPFTRKPCIAYQVKVKFEGHDDARPSEWILKEINATDFLLQGISIKGNNVNINDKSGHGAEAFGNNSEVNFEQFLRQRGLSLWDGNYRFYESVILPNVPVTAEINEMTQIAMLRSH